MKNQMLLVSGAALVCAAVLVGARSGQQTESERIAELETEVDTLTTRVSKLEYVVHEAIDEARGRDVAVVHEDAPASAPNGRYMIVDSITISEHTEDFSKEIERLDRDVRTLEQTIMNEERQLAQISGESYGTQNSGSSRKNTRYKSQQSVLSNYRRTLQNKQREMKRLESAQDEQKQIIHGRAGDTVITLVTRSDLAKQLSEISLDEYVTWAGKRISMDRGSETWEVTRVSGLEE